MDLKVDVEDERWTAIADLEKKLQEAASAVAVRRAVTRRLTARGGVLNANDYIRLDWSGSWLT